MKLTTQSKAWWKNFSDRDDAMLKLQFPCVFDEIPSPPFKNTREELQALKFNQKRFGIDYSDEIARLERVIAGTQEAFEAAEREKSRAEVSAMIEKLKADGHWK